MEIELNMIITLENDEEYLTIDKVVKDDVSYYYIAQLNEEKNGLVKDIEEFNKILSSNELQVNIIKERLEELVKKYGDKRRTELAQIDVPKEDKEIVAVIPEDVVVMVSQSGDVNVVGRIYR